MIATPWGDVAVSDSHVHFFSHRFLSLLASQKGCDVAALQPLLGWKFPPEDPARLAADWAAELDRHGVDGAALIASLPGDESSVLAAIAKYPDRFYGYFMVNPVGAANAAEGVSNILAAGGRAVCLFPAMHCYSLHDTRVRAVLDVVARHPGAVAFVHCGVLSVGVRKKLGLPSPFDLRFSNPVDVHALALAYPSLPFVIPHFGAGYLREALMVCGLCPNVYLDTSSTNSWTAFQESPMVLRDVFDRALAVVGPTRLLFGTDSSFFPRGWHRAVFDAQVAALGELGLASDDARAIFGGNLRRLLVG